MKEMESRHEYLGNERVETIYFGGGTPSLLTSQELAGILEKAASLWPLSQDAEITLEANPDDISSAKLAEWRAAGINRLSIGVQSFFEEDLRWMNRAHTVEQAIGNLRLATSMFANISMDLIYGLPGLTDEKWRQNVQRGLEMDIPHFSCYALTVEPKTPLDKMIRLGQAENVDPGQQAEQFLLLMDWMEKAGYEQYEISNFARPGYRSRHNSSYWQGKKYLGLGPSAHSFDGDSRQWNVSNNMNYIEGIRSGSPNFEKEILTPVQKTNEYIMTSLRTSEGLDLERIQNGGRENIEERSRRYMSRGLLNREGDHLVLTREGRLQADGIAADLFFI